MAPRLEVSWALTAEIQAFLAGKACCLSLLERQRAALFSGDVERLRYTTRHAWVRHMLSARTGLPACDIQFSVGPHGKPTISGQPFFFNLSSARDLSLLVVGQLPSIGCDIERVDPEIGIDAIAELFFSPWENARLRELSPETRRAAFFAAWTRKEAFLKAVGCGLHQPLDAFEVEMRPGHPARLRHGCGGFTVRSFEPLPGFEAAIVAPGTWDLVVGPSLELLG